MFTAIILSASPVGLQLPGVVVLPHVRTLHSMEQLHAARLDALARVQTRYCFFLDDDDALPPDYALVLAECAKQMTERCVPLAYTDEILREAGQADVRRSWYDYNHDMHAAAPMGIHHLAVMDTQRAQELARTLPRGNYWTEHILYWALGAQGAAYVPQIGYIWNRNPAGFSRKPQVLGAQVMSRRWIAMQQGAASC